MTALLGVRALTGQPHAALLADAAHVNRILGLVVPGAFQFTLPSRVVDGRVAASPAMTRLAAMEALVEDAIRGLGLGNPPLGLWWACAVARQVARLLQDTPLTGASHGGLTRPIIPTPTRRGSACVRRRTQQRMASSRGTSPTWRTCYCGAGGLLGASAGNGCYTRKPSSA
jgi:hypothetical protein